MIVLGIDPGLTGALALIGHRRELLQVGDIPTMTRYGATAAVKRQVNGAALDDLIREWTQGFDKNELAAFIEMPIAMPKLHVSSIGASFFTAGIIEGVLAARRIQHQPVAAVTWKKAMKLPPRGQRSHKEWKEEARARAIRYYPDAPLSLAKHHNRAEAILIARYGFEEVS